MQSLPPAGERYLRYPRIWLWTYSLVAPDRASVDFRVRCERLASPKYSGLALSLLSSAVCFSVESACSFPLRLRALGSTELQRSSLAGSSSTLRLAGFKSPTDRPWGPSLPKMNLYRREGPGNRDGWGLGKPRHDLDRRLAALQWRGGGGMQLAIPRGVVGPQL